MRKRVSTQQNDTNLKVRHKLFVSILVCVYVEHKIYRHNPEGGIALCRSLSTQQWSQHNFSIVTFIKNPIVFHIEDDFLHQLVMIFAQFEKFNKK